MEKMLKNSLKRKTIVTSLIAVIVMALVVVLVLPQEIGAKQAVPLVKSQGNTVKEGFFFSICGEQKDPSKVAGTPLNPAVIKRGSEITIPFCVRSTDTTAKTWELAARDSVDLGKSPQNGISVSFDGNSLQVPAYAGNVDDFAKGKGNTLTFNAHFGANTAAKTGIQRVIIEARHPTDFGTQVLGYVVYLNVQ
ncbi:MAG: hypothetical protein KGI02_08725 [Thaumarchaeota archaeon]|nr:hypothetical protein [Nitrososphaerota archaeon]